MPDKPARNPGQIGLTRRPEQGDGRSAADIIALALTALWVATCAAFFFVVPGAGAQGIAGNGAFGFVMTVLAVFMPIGMIWMATWAARAHRVMREESHRLQAAVDAMRQAYIAANQAQGSAQQRPDLDRRVDDLIRGQKRLEAVLTAREALPDSDPPPPPVQPAPRPAAPADADTDDQPALALGTPAEAMAPPLSSDDFIRALNFPENEGDREGFRALRAALKDRKTSGLVRSAQDMLTLLAEDGIYMDDLTPDKARPEVWRRFAAGDRGREIASLGGVRDRSSLALTAGRMRQDPVFRDVAHHFLRKFDTAFVDFEKGATDADIISMSDTRTARAFMLLGRVSGTFD